ncbi:hypothetical protein OXX79_013437 [Metschnikowia pulcherrima]
MEEPDEKVKVGGTYDRFHPPELYGFCDDVEVISGNVKDDHLVESVEKVGISDSVAMEDESTSDDRVGDEDKTEEDVTMEGSTNVGSKDVGPMEED